MPIDTTLTCRALTGAALVTGKIPIYNEAMRRFEEYLRALIILQTGKSVDDMTQAGINKRVAIIVLPLDLNGPFRRIVEIDGKRFTFEITFSNDHTTTTPTADQRPTE